MWGRNNFLHIDIQTTRPYSGKIPPSSCAGVTLVPWGAYIWTHFCWKALVTPSVLGLSWPWAQCVFSVLPFQIPLTQPVCRHGDRWWGAFWGLWWGQWGRTVPRDPLQWGARLRRPCFSHPQVITPCTGARVLLPLTPLLVVGKFPLLVHKLVKENLLHSL